MIEPDHPDLSIGQPCKLLSIARSSFAWTGRLRRSGGRISPAAHANMRCRAADARKGAVPRQHLHREVVADPDIRMRQPARLGGGIGDEDGHPETDDLLQPPTLSFSSGWQATGAGLLAEE